ncbi:unnamed protein product [marine sediment metagenome]|uniref:Uncharacterized protein n=1 Tax=marine sediment metagenome TaxID=412755 RepID=X1SMP8_9ZZZZ
MQSSRLDNPDRFGWPENRRALSFRHYKRVKRLLDRLKGSDKRHTQKRCQVK